MKHIAIIAALLLSAVATFAQNGRNLYQKYSGAEGVSAVYISPAMFRMIGKIPDLQVEDGSVNLGPIIQSLSGFYLLNSENKEINANLRTEAEKFVGSGRYEMLMEVKDSGETVGMYTVGDGKTVNSFVMIARDGDELTFICLDGKMNRDDLENLLANEMK